MTTDKSYQLSAFRPEKYVCQSVSGVISKKEAEGGGATTAGDIDQRGCATQALNFQTKLELSGFFQELIISIIIS